MIYLNSNREIKTSEITIVTDFDKTVTAPNSESTIGVFSKFLPQSYVESKSLINEREIEIFNNTIISDTKKALLLEEIWKEKLMLLSKYLKTQKLINEISDSKLFVFRDEAIEAINYLQKKYQVVIISSGIGNLVSQLLKDNGCFTEKIKIFSNFYNFSTFCFDMQNCIFPSKQGNVYYKKEIYGKKLVLFGDTIEDLNMAPDDKNLLFSIGFLDEQYDKYLELYNRLFDMVATENESYAGPIRRLKL